MEAKLTTRQIVMVALAESDMTTAQMAALLGLHRNTVDYHLRRAHGDKRAHVCGWDRHEGTQGDWARIYRIGEGEDVPEPKVTKQTQRMYSRRYYRANRAIVRARAAAREGGLMHYFQLLA